MSRSIHFAARNSAKRRVLVYLCEQSGYVTANRLMKAGLVSIRSYRNVYSILGRMTRWELLERRTGALGLAEWTITAKGRQRLEWYQRKGAGA